jgi:hypothetical protein
LFCRLGDKIILSGVAKNSEQLFCIALHVKERNLDAVANRLELHSLFEIIKVPNNFQIKLLSLEIGPISTHKGLLEDVS